MMAQETAIVQVLLPAEIAQEVGTKVKEPVGAGVTVLVAEQLAVVPPPDPAQDHDHGPDPVTEEAVPVEQRLVVGAVVKD